MKKFRPTFTVIALLLFGSANGLAQLALVRQGRESGGALETGDFFGGALATGDFNGDGFDDVAAGAPYEKIGAAVNAGGAVLVNYGSPLGVTWLGARLLLPADGGYSNSSLAQMGFALAAGDFNNDGYDDLAVGLPAATVNGQASAGMIFVYLGSASGLSASAAVLDQSNFGALVEANDRFGAAVATGRLGSDAFADLAIGSPGENTGAGAVFVIFGYLGGVNTSAVLALDSAAIGVTPQTNAGLGSALAIGNIRGASFQELIIGAPNTDVGVVLNTGNVHVVTGNSSGLNTGSVLHWDITRTGEAYQADSLFGFSLAIGNLYGDGDGSSDLAIGIPGMAQNAGRVSIERGTSGNPIFSMLLDQYDGLATGPGTFDEPGDLFGWAVATGDVNGDGIDDLAVGAPGEADHRVKGDDGDNNGWVQIFRGGNTGVANSSGFESYGEVDLGDKPDGNASLGYALAFGRTSASSRHSLLAGAPAEDAATGQYFDIAPWRQVLAPGCRSALAADCQDKIIYALRPFEHVRIASTTKIMTVLLGCEATARPANDPLHVALNENYLIEAWLAAAFPPNSGCSIFGYAPFSDVHSFEQLLRGCVMVSGNDSAYAIADAMTEEADAWNGHTGTVPEFVALMNARAAQIGMNDTLFTNPPGVDNGSPYSSAGDMWLLAREAMGNTLFRDIVGTTEFYFNRFVPGDEVGMFFPSYDKISYGWLTEMQSREARVLGLKPGGTPGAGTTGVVAAHTSFSADDLAYATGFGWDDGTLAKDRLAALVQLAIAQCDPFVPPGGLKGPGGPLGFSVWQGHDAQREGLQVMDFVSRTDLPSGTPEVGDEVIVMFVAGAAIPAGADPVVPARASYRPLFQIAPGSMTGVEARLVSGFAGSLRNDGSDTIALTLNFTPPGNVVTLNLAPGQEYHFTTWSAPAGQTATHTFRLTFNGQTTAPAAVVGCDLRYNFDPNLSGAPAPVFRGRIKPDTGPVRASLHVSERTIGSGPSFPVLVAIEDPAGGLRYSPPIKTDSFTLTRSPASDEVVLLWSSIPGIGFYESFDIETTTELSRSSVWSRVTSVPVDPSGHHSFTRRFPPGPTRFLRARGNLID